MAQSEYWNPKNETLPREQLQALQLAKLQRDEFAEPAGEDASPLAERISQSNAISPQMVKMKADQWIDRQVFHQRTLPCPLVYL